VFSGTELLLERAIGNYKRLSAGHGKISETDLAELLQRVALAVGFGWLTLLAVHSLRGPSSEDEEQAAFRVR